MKKNNIFYIFILIILNNVFQNQCDFDLYQNYLFYFDNFKIKLNNISNNIDIKTNDLIDLLKELHDLYNKNENKKQSELELLKIKENIIKLKEKLKMNSNSSNFIPIVNLENNLYHSQLIESLYFDYIGLKKFEEIIKEKKISENTKNWELLKFFIKKNTFILMTYAVIITGFINYYINNNKKNKKLINQENALE